MEDAKRVLFFLFFLLSFSFLFLGERLALTLLCSSSSGARDLFGFF